MEWIQFFSSPESVQTWVLGITDMSKILMSNENFLKAAECELTTSHIRWSCTTFRWRQGNNLCISGFQEASIRIRCQQASHYCFISASSLHMFLPRGPIFRIDARRMMAVINERSWQNTNAGKQQELRGMGGGYCRRVFIFFLCISIFCCWKDPQTILKITCCT